MSVAQEPSFSEAPTGSEAISREKLILEHLPQVKLIAGQIRDRLPVTVSLDDLVSAGIVGLIAAIDRYDERQKVKLRTYAEYKIRGAILDSLREMDWAPRQQRRRARLVDSAMSALENQLKRVPSDEEIAHHLGTSLNQYQKWLSALHRLTLASLDLHTASEGKDLLQSLASTSEDSPSQIAERAELERLLADKIKSLSKLEQTILSLYYKEELTLREIARIVNLHESRISQIKSQAISRLRSILDKN